LCKYGDEYTVFCCLDAASPPHPELDKTHLYTASTLIGDPKLPENAPFSFYDTSPVHVYVLIWIHAHMSRLQIKREVGDKKRVSWD